MKTLHCISGLPRSGSTLLSSILNQNPKFFAAVTDPLNNIVNNIVSSFEYNGWYQNILTNDKKIEILQNVVQTYYKDIDADVCFNTGRFWTSRLPILAMFSPNTKVICCVRDISSIINSFEKLRNNEILNPIRYLYGRGQTAYERAEILMRNDNIVGECIESFKQAYYGPFAKNLVIVEYDVLVANPQDTMKKLYASLGLEYFNHDFNNLSPIESLDDPYMPKTLHHVPKKVQAQKSKPCIPPDLWNRFSGMEFWRYETKIEEHPQKSNFNGFAFSKK